MEIFAPRLETLCRDFAEAVKWKYGKWKYRGAWACAVTRPHGIFNEPQRIVLSLSVSEIEVYSLIDGAINPSYDYPAFGHMSLNLDTGRFNEEALSVSEKTVQLKLRSKVKRLKWPWQNNTMFI